MDDQAWAWLEPALKRGRDGHLSRAAIEQGIARGELALWRGETAAFVTYLIANAQGRFCHGWLAGGSLAGVLALRPGIEAWARGQGAQFTSLDGRPGWDRLLQPFGYRRIGTELVKTL